MKFELQTDNEYFSKAFVSFFLSLMAISLIIVISDIALKLGSISRFNEINYRCRLLTVDKSPSNFKKLSKLSKQINKQKIWDLCREIIK